ncbi:MAG: hypothetical protein V3S22_01155, partial [Candidatus Neomarinimicrobiota bacterium]
ETFLSSNRRLLKSSHAAYPSCTIIEPVFIGKNCTLLDSRIGPFVTVMDNTQIHKCKIEDSIVLANSKLENLQIKARIVGRDGSEYC